MATKSFGGPPSFEPPNPKRQQKAATPASPAQVGDYLDHMVKADQEYHARKKAQGAPPPVRGSSQGPKTPKGSNVMIDQAVDKMDH